MKVRACLRCGCDVPQPKTARRLRCEPCAYQVELDALAAKRRAQGIVPIGATIACADCSAQIVKDHGCRRLCDPCKLLRRRASSAKLAAKPERKAYQREREGSRRKTPERASYMRDYLARYATEYNSRPIRKINRRVSQMVRSGLGAGKAGRSWQKLLDFTLDELAAHLERQFTKGMTWENMGEWQIDHIIPVSLFSFETENDPDFKAAWALTNLRPLWKTENLQKNAKRLHLI